MSENQMASLQIARNANISPQAKAKGAAVFWEGVAVLPAISGGPVDDYLNQNENNLRELARKMEKQYGIKVLHMSIHLDEGKYFEETGDIHYNPHAHIILDRSLSNGKLWTPKKTELAGFQTMAAECLQMKRGLTVYERGGAPSRKNIDHRTYREMHEKSENTPDFEKKLKAAESENAALRDQNLEANNNLAEIQEKRSYDVFRAFLKGTGKARQSDYQALKKIYNEDRLKFNSIYTIFDQDDNPDADEVLWRLRGGEYDLYLETKTTSSGSIAARSGLPGPSLPEDLVIDPFIRWNPNGEDLYLLPERDEKLGRLAFRDCGDRINVRLKDDKTIVAALLLSRQKWPEGPILVDGQPDFVNRCIELGIKNNILVEPRIVLYPSQQAKSVDMKNSKPHDSSPGPR
ncbi:LPD7 domain-containing protein [Comamonas odontotermitis]